MFTPDSDLDYGGLNLAPAIFQEAVDVDCDLRITVVGDEAFPATVKAEVEKDLKIGVRDWRIGNNVGNLLVEACDIPDDIKQKCLSLVKNFGLKFGAIDMIRDKQGNYWFIEINPNGQWGFVEAETGQPIGRAIARLLLSGVAALK